LIGGRGVDNGLQAELLSSARRGRLGKAASVVGLVDTTIIDWSMASTVPSVVLFHNQPLAVRGLRRSFPQAKAVLYAHNALLTRLPEQVAARLMGRYDGIIFVSQSLADEYKRRMRKRLPPSTVIRNGVDVSAFEGAHAQPAQDVDVTFVGRLTPEKGPDVLVRALETLKARGVAVRARIVGGRWFYGDEPPSQYEVDLREKAIRSGLDVEFTGVVPPGDVPGLMDRSRLVVIPSTWDEPLGLTVLEALASSAAVVASEVGGIPEVATGGARLVPPGDVEALADELQALLADAEGMLELARAGRRLAEGYSYERAYQELASFLEAL
jgi:glycosyltransferase involved in cell wall biosynthesis